jgi:GNAT superfamily N-acetyltransferase
MTVTIRRAGPADAEAVHRLIVALATYERAADHVVATPAGLASDLASERPPFECSIAFYEGEVVGFALYFHNYSTWRGKRGLYLEDLFVLPEHRKKGIGFMLFEELVRIARERGCARLEWAVLDWNTPAIDFYRSLGAIPLDEWTVFRLDPQRDLPRR